MAEFVRVECCPNASVAARRKTVLGNLGFRVLVAEEKAVVILATVKEQNGDVDIKEDAFCTKPPSRWVLVAHKTE